MTITVTPTVDASNSPPRIKLNVAASAGETSTTVTRLDPSGAWVPVRTTDGNPLQLSAGSGLLYDYEPPYGQSVKFSSVESPATVSSSVTLSPSRPWLVHVGVPALSITFRFSPNPSPRRVRPVVRGVFQPLGRVNPIIVTDGARHGRMLALSLLLEGPSERAAFEALTADASTLLLNVPSSLGYNVDTAYISIGDIETLPVMDKVFEQWFTVTMPYYEVDRPLGGQQPQRTLADLMSYATLADLNSHYATLNDLYVGP
jgi:hypothetical protein